MLSVRWSEIGTELEKFAHSICADSVSKELELSGDSKVNIGASSVDLTASFDMGWQCKGSGKSYNSKSGHAVLGKNSGKIMNYATRISNCKQCEITKAVPHDGRMNWGGTSKAMEGDAAVELLKLTKSPDFKVTTIINEEDSITMARIAAEVYHEFEQNSDINHCKKAVGNELYRLEPEYEIFSSNNIRNIHQCFRYAISQNKDKPEKQSLHC